MPLSREDAIRFALMIFLVLLFYWVSLTIRSVGIFTVIVFISYVLQQIYFRKAIPAPHNLLPLYLFALAIQMLHFAEEYVMGFNEALPALFGSDPYPLTYWVVFNMVVYAFFIAGAIIIFMEWGAFYLVPIFFVLMAVIANAVGHIALSIYSGGYFPGLYTAMAYVLVGPLLLRKLFYRQDDTPI